MSGTMKNREVFPVGTRVKFAHEKLSTAVGTVVEHSEDGKRMMILWDGRAYPMGGYWPPELKEAK